MSGKRDVPGNARESALRAQEYLLNQAVDLNSTERVADKLFESGWVLVSIRLKFPAGEGGGYLAIVKAEGPEGSMVGFHDGTTFAEVVVGMVRRLHQGGVKWKRDEWTGSKGPGVVKEQEVG